MNIILRLAALCKFELLICSEKISSHHSLLRCCSFIRKKFGSLRSLTVPMLTCYSLRFRQNCRFTRSLVSSNSGSMASLVISTFRRCAARLERQRQADNSSKTWHPSRQAPRRASGGGGASAGSKLTKSSRYANLCGGTWLAQARSARPFLFFLPVKENSLALRPTAHHDKLRQSHLL